MLRSGNGVQKPLGVDIRFRHRIAWSGLAEERSMRSSFAKMERVGVLQPVFDEEIMEIVTRERKRTDRSGLAMAILLIGVRDSRHKNTSALFAVIADALSAIKSDIDIAGWFERESIIGLIVPEIDPANLTSTCERLESEFRKEISDRFEGDLTDRLWLRLCVYPEPPQLGDDELPAVDPFLYPELYVQQDGIAMFQRLKRGMDILGSLALLLLLSPLLLAIAGLVKLSSRGPVLFHQMRIGQMLKPFMMCKFRSMHANADHGVHHNYVSWFITSSSKGQGQDKNAVFKLTNDPRITPIGHFLRRTLLECNHDADMLQAGRYPTFLKNRVGGQFGHLSNAQSAGIAAQLNHAGLHHVVAAHLSRQNNRPELARESLAQALGRAACDIAVADQFLGSDWHMV